MNTFRTIKGALAVILLFTSTIAAESKNNDKGKESNPSIQTAEGEEADEKQSPHVKDPKIDSINFIDFDFGGGSDEQMEEANHIAKSSDVVEQATSLKAHSFDIFGDHIDTYTGGLSFSHTDVSIPGNSNLEVAIRRTLTQATKYHPQQSAGFGDWELEVPRIYRKVAQPVRYSSYGWANIKKIGNIVVQWSRDMPRWSNSRCTKRDTEGPYYQLPNRWISARGAKTLKPNWSRPVLVSEWFYEEETYADGTHMAIPGQGAQEILDTPSGYIWNGVYKKVTKNHWKFECINNIDGGGEGFIAIAPNGDRWRFDKLVYRQAPYIRVYPKGMAIGGAVGIYSITGASWATLLASKVTDVNGNTVEYKYTPDGKLTRIHSNDGREINLIYSGRDIKTVTAQNRSWHYSYIPSNAARPAILESVTLPDNRRWSFNLSRMYWEALTGKACNLPNFSVSLTHPDGATASFELAETQRVAPSRASGTKNARCRYDPTASGWAYTSGWDRVFETVSVKKKSIEGTGIPASSWQYRYNNKYVSVTQPDMSRVDYEFYTQGAGEGKPKYKRTYNYSNLMQTEYYRYIQGPIMGRTFRYFGPRSSYKGDRQVDLLAESRTTVNGETYSIVNTYNTNLNSVGYSFGKPIKIEKYSTLQREKRITSYTYNHLKTNWIVGLTDIVKRNNKEVEHYGYDSLGRNTWLNRFGVRTITRRFNHDGTIKNAQDGENNLTQYSNYKSGKPQTIIRADNKVVQRSYDNFGMLTSQTDANLVTTNYEYDDANRLNRINRDGRWSDTLFYYSNSGNGLIQTEVIGQARVTTTHDRLLRPILVKTQPISGGGITSYVRTLYDNLGRVSFKSLASNNPNSNVGEETIHDALGRIIKVIDTALPRTEMRIRYLSDNRIHSTDENGYITVTKRSGYGSTSDGNTIEIKSPLAVTTQMKYDIFGNLNTVRQFGTQNGKYADFSHHFFYDNSWRLCRKRTPETGDTAYSYYKTNHLKSSAKGLVAYNGCQVPSGSTLMTRFYNNMNWIAKEDYADNATPDTLYSYDNNGDLKSLTRGGANWSYDYYDYSNLKQEKLSLDGYTWQTNYSYSDEMNLSSITLPSGRRLDYTLNGLGQIIQGQSNGRVYASNIAYHSNGVWSKIRYRNGHTAYQALNPKQQTQRLWSSHSTKPKAVDYTYTYDKRSNVTYIADGTSSANNRSFSYDGLNRIKSASGPFGNASFVYDAVGNILRKKIGSRSIYIEYDNTHNRVSSARSVGAGVPTATSNPFYSNFYYDNRGNTVDSGKVSFRYDAEDQPTYMSHGSGFSSFKYDGHKRRVKQVVNAANGTKTTYSVYSKGGILLHRHNITDNKRVDYLPLGQGSTANIRFENGVPRYIYSDRLGSPVSETDQYGNIVWKERYTPFGEKLDNPSANKDDQGFTGHITDDATGLVYMQARYYDPVIGRFYSNDPVGFRDVHSFNRYAYANNNPYKYIDPDGKDSFLVGRGLNAAWGAAGYVGGHLYVVSGAKFAGDTGPNVRYHSFGENGQGLTGLLSEGNEGNLSKGTTIADAKHWGSLSKDSAFAVNFSKNDALTQKLANAAIAEVPYELPSVETKTSEVNIGKFSFNVPTGTKLSSVINSNTMASAVANQATGSNVTLPKATGVLGYPGSENADKVNFREQQ